MKRLLFGAVCMLAVVGQSVVAQETLLDYVLDACEGDLVEFCDQVTPGGGRLLMCVAAHEDKISSDCAFALYDAATILQDLTDTIAYLAESCEPDIEAHCADTPPGEGRILACLEGREGDLSETCRAAIDEVVVEE